MGTDNVPSRQDQGGSTMTKRLVYIFTALLLVASACGGSDADAEATDTQATPTTDTATTEADEEPATDTTAAPSDESSSGGGSGAATLTLDNGESFEFSILCALQPQIAAGQEIIFTAV